MIIGIFSRYPVNPQHQRTRCLLDSIGNFADVDLVLLQSESRLLRYVIADILSLNFFSFEAVSSGLKKLSQYDYIYIQGMALLPLVIMSRLNNKYVVYETLDDNVALKCYTLSQYHAIFRFFRPLLYFLFSFLEKIVCRLFADRVVVNSEYLQRYFNRRVKLIYYCSPFETLPPSTTPECKKPMLLYLGAFSQDKGANEIIALAQKWKVPLTVFGDVQINDLPDSLAEDQIFKLSPRLSPEVLYARLADLCNHFRLVGVSMIKPVHRSYRHQEANKDIDYLAIGAPIIGNYRSPTANKIRAGCGCFFDQEQDVLRLLNDPDVWHAVSRTARKYYAEKYAVAHFQTQLKSLFAEISWDRKQDTTDGS